MSFTAKVEDGYLVIRAKLNERPTPSASGKTLVVASSGGNHETEAEHEGKRITVGFNAYFKP